MQHVVCGLLGGCRVQAFDEARSMLGYVAGTPARAGGSQTSVFSIGPGAEQ